MTTTEPTPSNGAEPADVHVHIELPAPDDALTASIRTDLQKMVAEPLTARALASISRYCGSAAQLLQTRATSKSKLRAADATENIAGGIPGAISLAQYMPAVDLAYDSDDVLAAAPASETYGVKAVRELMDALGKHQSKQNETPLALVRALAEARDLGLTDVVKELSAKFGIPVTMSKPRKSKRRTKRSGR